jgi:EAL domain-containing protein (putative c-di-GMP-specific phosphodiesterase class I)
MYHAKGDGRNTIRFYNPEMQKAADRRLLLEKELREAIRLGEFEMQYQPQIDVDGALAGCEALIRWVRPGNVVVSPEEFIPVVEENGLILELGQWILNDACEFLRCCSVGHVAVNISPLQFRQQNFVGCIKDVLEKTGTDPSRLMIELTEGMVIENIDETIEKMNSLKEMGIRFSIDDFGTGYSSLAYLKRLPLDQLKISGDFIRDINTDPNDAVIVETIISMARHLGFDVVAEAVEEEGQIAFLKQKGCHIFQGHYYSVPLRCDEFEAYLHKQTAVQG